MKTGIVKNSFSMLLMGLLVLSCFALFQLLGWIQAGTRQSIEEIEQAKRDIQIVRTLSTEGPKDIREVDLLQKLTGYCTDVGIKPLDCSIKSQTPVSNNEYLTQRYSVMIQNILMDAAIDYYQKLDELPENVRVVQSSLQRVEVRGARQEERPPFLVLKIEMNEIKFRQ
jgi:hypothetical protein